MRASGDMKKLGRAILAVAKQVETVHSLVAHLELLRSIYHEDRSFRHLMVTKRIAPAEKMDALRSSFKDNLGPLEYELLSQLLEAQDGAALPAVTKMITQMAVADASYLSMTVTSAEALSEAELADMGGRLEKKLGRTIQVSGQTDASLLGGLKIRLGNTLVDGTVARRLEMVRQELAG